MDKETTRLRKIGALGNAVAGMLRAETLIRLVGIPFQKFFDKAGGTHKLLTEQALAILRTDGLLEAAAFYGECLDTVIRGNYWADLLWKNATHHYNPKTRRGLWIWPGAADQLRSWWRIAVSSWRKGNKKKSLFMLGACLHIVQDCCQPYHSNCVVFDGHQRYERWADERKAQYVVDHGGLYGVSLQPEGWATANADFSCGHLESVASRLDCDKDRATSVLLPRAMRTGAGFLLFFWENVCASCVSFRDKRVAAG